ncbi:MAG: hypothetical protein WKF97_03135 [Chitinophagaceae bacterium]
MKNDFALFQREKFSLILLCLILLLPACKKKIKSDSFGKLNFSFHERNPGASAGEFLGDDKFTFLKVEMQYMVGFEPDRKAIENFQTFLYKYLHKPGGIYIVKRKIAALHDTVLSEREVDSIRRANRTVYTRSNQLALYILYTNGEFENPDILGLACRNTSIIIYGKPVKQYGAAFTVPTQTTIETTLLLHEMEHLLGLVNKSSAMQAEHSDTAHEAHCINPNCIMY